MGGRSSSATSTTNFVDSSTLNAAQTGSDVAVTGDGNRTQYTVNTTTNTVDGGAFDVVEASNANMLDSIKAGFGFGEESLDFSSEQSARVFDLSGEALSFGSESLDAMRNVVNSGLNFADESSARSFEFGAGSVDAALGLSRSLVESTLNINSGIVQRSIDAATNNSERAYQFATALGRPQDINTDNVKMIASAVAVVAIAYFFSRKRA